MLGNSLNFDAKNWKSLQQQNDDPAFRQIADPYIGLA